MSEREKLLEEERKESLRDLIESVLYGSWMPGVTDTVIFEKVDELEKREEGNK